MGDGRRRRVATVKSGWHKEVLACHSSLGNNGLASGGPHLRHVQSEKVN